MTSRTPFLKRKIHKWRNKRNFPQAMLFTLVPLLPSPSLGGWAPTTFWSDIRSIHVRQMPHARDGDTWILHRPPTETILNVHFMGRVPPLGRHRTKKKVHCAVLSHKASTMAHRPMHPYRCLPPLSTSNIAPMFGPIFRFSQPPHPNSSPLSSTRCESGPRQATWCALRCTPLLPHWRPYGCRSSH